MMRALLRDKEDHTLIVFEVEEAIYDPQDLIIQRLLCSGK